MAEQALILSILVTAQIRLLFVPVMGVQVLQCDVIADFTNGSDIIGLSGLNYSDLTVQQGTGSYSSHVVVQEKSSGDFLLIIQNQSIGNIDDNDFSAI